MVDDRQITISYTMGFIMFRFHEFELVGRATFALYKQSNWLHEWFYPYETGDSPFTTGY